MMSVTGNVCLFICKLNTTLTDDSSLKEHNGFNFHTIEWIINLKNNTRRTYIHLQLKFT